MVCSRFSAWSKTMLAGDSKTSSVTSRPSVMPVCSMISRPTTVFGVVERRQAVHELDLRVAGRVEERRVDLVRREQLDALVPDVLGLAHRDPHVGVDEVDAATASAGSSVMVMRAPVRPARSRRCRRRRSGGAELVRPAEADVAAHERAHDQQRAAHVEAAVAHERVGDLVVGLVARLVHGQEVGEHLRGVPLVGQAVVDGHARRSSASSSTSSWRVAAELDGVVHPAEHAGGVGDRLLVAELRAGRVEVGDVRALVVGRDLERRRGCGSRSSRRSARSPCRRGAAPRCRRTWRSSAPPRAAAGSAARRARSRSP